MDRTRGIVLAGVALVAMLVFVTLLRSYTVINSGYVGVRRTFGDIHKQSLQPGLHWITPWIDDVTPMETRLKSFEVEASAASKDLQIVKTKISVQHSLNGELAPESYAAIGDLDKFDYSVVSPAVMESLKAVMAKYTAEELITKREIVKQQTSDAIQSFITHTLQEKQIEGALHIANVAIKDFDFSAEFNSSIEAKVRAQQEALRAENEKAKRITEAEASARERELSADAEAYQVEKVSIQRAKAIEREATALAQNPLLLQLRAIEKWNGTVPGFVGGDKIVPFLDVQKAIEK
jgi:prohibitin 2